MEKGVERRCLAVCFVWFFTVTLLLTGNGYAFGKAEKTSVLSGTEKWDAIGLFGAETAFDMIGKEASGVQKGNLVVVTTAGFAEVGGETTQGVLDGLSRVTGASRGRNTLVEVHTAPWKPLWFSVYDILSGYCVYFEVDPEKTVGNLSGVTDAVFIKKSMEKVDSETIYSHADEFKKKMGEKVFGGNEFRIITISNAIAKNSPTDVVRAFEFHDHYCPGVTSGVLMARYLKKFFPPGKSGYFIHTVSPWCKEDALIVLLNATPGKRGYCVHYPSEADTAQLGEDMGKIATLAYRLNDSSGKWEGVALSFDWNGKKPCPETGNPLADKLCMDLWYLEKIDSPELFVKTVKQFELEKGVDPKSWARPGVDPLVKLGLKQIKQ